MNRTLACLKRTRRCMTTMQLLSTLRAQAPVSKGTIRAELNDLMARGEVTQVAGVYYVRTRDLARARRAHLEEIYAFLAQHGPARRKQIIDGMGISACFLEWVLKSAPQTRVLEQVSRHSALLVAREPKKGTLPCSPRRSPSEDRSAPPEHLIQRVLEGVRTANERRDSVTRLCARLEMTREAILACAQALVQRGALAIQQGLLTVLVFVRDPDPLPSADAATPAPVRSGAPVPGPARARRFPLRSRSGRTPGLEVFYERRRHHHFAPRASDAPRARAAPGVARARAAPGAKQTAGLPSG